VVAEEWTIPERCDRRRATHLRIGKIEGSDAKEMLLEIFSSRLGGGCGLCGFVLLRKTPDFGPKGFLQRLKPLMCGSVYGRAEALPPLKMNRKPAPSKN
jgi:hypothetical protein